MAVITVAVHFLNYVGLRAQTFEVFFHASMSRLYESVQREFSVETHAKKNKIVIQIEWLKLKILQCLKCDIKLYNTWFITLSPTQWSILEIKN